MTSKKSLFVKISLYSLPSYVFNIKNEAFPPIDFESKLSKVKRKVNESMSVYKLHDFLIIFKYSGKSHFFCYAVKKLPPLELILLSK